jgi:hypothetical protein
MTLWIPNDVNPASKTMDIAETMMRDFGVTRINNDTYNNGFDEYYDQHIRQGETHNTFCSKDGKGINVEYLISNANKKSYITLLSLDINPAVPDDFHVLALMVFKWSPTAGSAKIQAFCSNQKQQTKGAGTKLLNFLKKTLTHMGINNIYLNPVPGAIPYYSSQRFVEAKTPGKKIYDTSSSKSRSRSKSKTKSKPKPKSPKQQIPTMTINLRAANNWSKTKTKMRSYQALTRKTHGKSHIPSETKKLLKKIDEIVNGLSSDHRDMAQAEDIIDILDRHGKRLNDEEEDIVIAYLRKKYQIY